MRVLALDIATTTGYAVLSRQPEGWRIDALGTIDVTPAKGEPMGVRFRKFQMCLRTLLHEHEPTAIAIEDNHSRSFHAAKVQGGFLGVALAEIEGVGTEYALPTVGEWKKHVAGKGNAKKPEVRKALNGWLGIKPSDAITLDESDALGVARWLIDCALVTTSDP